MSNELIDFSRQIEERFNWDLSEKSHVPIISPGTIMNTIVVATDFSKLADNAVHYAAAMAKHYNAKLVIFNAFMLSVPGANALLTSADFDELLLDNKNLLEKKAKEIQRRYMIKVKCEMTYSVVAEELENVMKKYNDGLLVLGMEDDDFIQRFFGNTTTTMIKKLNCPILAVPNGACFEGFKRILFACDILDSVPEGILPKIKAIAARENAELEIFFVEKNNVSISNINPVLTGIESIKSCFSGINYSYKGIKSDNVIGEIKREINNFDADIVIMIPKIYGFWNSIVHHSKTQVMAAGLAVPLLTMHA